MSIRLYRDTPVSLGRRLGPRRSPWRKRFSLAGVVAGLAGAFALAGPPISDAPSKLLATGIRPAQAAAPHYHADCSARPTQLQQELSGIAESFSGKVGIAVAKAGCDWTVGARLNDFFPQQSVSKLWVSLTVLDAVDQGSLRLDQPLTIRPEDLTLFNQPLRWQVLEQGSVTLPVHDLMQNALSLSDNTANDRLLWTAGGPDRVRAMMADKGISGIRFGPGERLLQSAISGLRWDPSYSLGSNFEQARARLPKADRVASLDRYVADPMDGAQPAGMARALARLAAGELLSPQSTAVIMDILSRTHSGPRRLKGGLVPGWKIFHKTGTGQELAGTATGYNDVAIVQAPDGTFYAVAVMIGQTRQPIPERMKMMHEVMAALSRFHASTEMKVASR